MTTQTATDRIIRVPLEIELSDHWFKSAQISLFTNSDESYESVRALLDHEHIAHEEHVVDSVPIDGRPTAPVGLCTAWTEANVMVTCHSPRGYFAEHRRDATEGQS